MAVLFSPILLFSFLIVLISTTPQAYIGSNSTSTYMRVIGAEYPVSLKSVRDKYQNVLSMEGVSVEILQWLAQYDKFTYSFLPIYLVAIANTSKDVGGTYYVHSGRCDLIIGSLVMTADRYIYLDFPHPWMEEPAVLLIPVPVPSTNMGSIWQPFQLSVWILIGVSVIMVLFALYVLTSPLVFTLLSADGIVRSTKNWYKPASIPRFNQLGLYVFGLLLSQGGFFRSKHNAGRFVAGAWCLATFVLVQAYSSTLISFMTTPHSIPLVKSPEDLISKAHVHLTVHIDHAIDIILTNSQDPFLKQLGNKIKYYPYSRCILVEECLAKVASGGHVFIHGYGAILEAMNNDFKKTGQCRFSLANKFLHSSSYSWGLSKKSPRTEAFNRGLGYFIRNAEVNRLIELFLNLSATHRILQVREKGLVLKWLDHFQTKPRQCLDEEKYHNRKKIHPNLQLSLQHFSGAFVLLCTGSLLSLLAFIAENMYKRYFTETKPIVL